jgi:hypothetical protein
MPPPEEEKAGHLPGQSGDASPLVASSDSATGSDCYVPAREYQPNGGFFLNGSGRSHRYAVLSCSAKDLPSRPWSGARPVSLSQKRRGYSDPRRCTVLVTQARNAAQSCSAAAGRDLIQFIRPGGFIGVVDIAFTRELRSIEDAPEYLRPQYPKHWSYVHSVEWWKRHWEKTGLVDVQYAALLPESNDLLRDYVLDRPPEQDEDSIMRVVPHDHEGLIALFCLIARKR